MISRDDVIQQAIDGCLKELYSYAQPTISWKEFQQECNDWAKNYIKNGVQVKDAPPKPYEFYYLPSDIFKSIAENYANAYELNPDLKNTIEILKQYCKEPIVDKYIDEYTDENGNWHPGHRGYDYPNNLVLELIKMIGSLEIDEQTFAKELQDKFFEFLDMAGNFYRWDKGLQSFNASIYLGVSPNSNKEAVIKNWKEFRNKDIEIKEINLEDFENEYYV